MAGSPKLIDKLYSSLASEVAPLLRSTVAAADERGERAYLAGGAVRDLLRDESPVDVDVVIDGDAVAIARAVACRTGAALRKVSRFSTATLVAATSHFDLVSARSERYPRPGSLPIVEPGSIDSDLRRRDFSINAMAIALNGYAPGKVIDPTGGRKDLQAGVVRVLHERSFRDDATRMLRAVRFEVRLGFSIESGTRDALVRDVSFLSTISGTRIRAELKHALLEEEAGTILARMSELGILKAIHPALSFSAAQAHALDELRFASGDSLVARLAVACWRIDPAQIDDVTLRLSLTREQRAAVVALPLLRTACSSIAANTAPSAVAAMFRRFPLASVVALSCVSEAEVVQRRAEEFIDSYRRVRPMLRGDDLIRIGVPSGPAVAEVLAQLRDNRLDGQLETREDEMKLTRKWMAKRSPAYVN